MKTVTLVLAGLLCVSSGAEAGFVTYEFHGTTSGPDGQPVRALFTYESDPPASSYELVTSSDFAPEFSVGSSTVTGARGTLYFTEGGPDDDDSVAIDISNADFTSTILITILGADFFDDAGALIPANIASGSASIIAAVDFHPISGEGVAIRADLTNISLTRSDPAAPEPGSLALLVLGMVGVGAPAARRQPGHRKC